METIGEVIQPGQTREAFQRGILERLPPHLRESMAREFKRLNTLTEEELAAEMETQRKAREAESYRVYLEGLREGCGLRGQQCRNIFSNYLPAGTPEQKRTQAAAAHAAKEFCKARPLPKIGLVFWGEEGRGKDHLLHAITNTLMGQKRSLVVRYDFSLDINRRLLAEWQRHDDPETATEARLREADCVLIGDLHRLFGSADRGVMAARVEEALWRIIDQAASTGKPTLCFTTNFPLEGDSAGRDWYSMAGCDLGSRLASVAAWHEVQGPDRRRPNV